MPTKPLEAARHEFARSLHSDALAGFLAVRRSHLRGLRFPRPAPAQGSRPVHPLVFSPLPHRWNRNRLGDVPLLPVVARAAEPGLTVDVLDPPVMPSSRRTASRPASG